MTNRKKIEGHFVDSSTLCEVCQLLCLGVLKKLGIEWNRTADSRMVLTERRDITTDDEVQNIAHTWTGGSWVLSQVATEGLFI